MYIKTKNSTIFTIFTIFETVSAQFAALYVYVCMMCVQIPIPIAMSIKFGINAILGTRNKRKIL